MATYTQLSQPYIAGCAGCGHVFVTQGQSPTCPLCNRLAEVTLSSSPPNPLSPPGSPSGVLSPPAGDLQVELGARWPRDDAFLVADIFLRQRDRGPDELRLSLADIGLDDERVGPTVSRLVAIRDDLYSLQAESTNPGTEPAVDTEPAEASADPQGPVDMDIECPHCQGAIRLKVTEQDIVVEAITPEEEPPAAQPEHPEYEGRPPLATPEAAMETAYNTPTTPNNWDE